MTHAQMLELAEKNLSEASEHLTSPKGNWELARIKAEIGTGWATLALSVEDETAWVDVPGTVQP